MNRFFLVGTQVDTSGQEWAYLYDEQTGQTIKSPVMRGALTVPAPNAKLVNNRDAEISLRNPGYKMPTYPPTDDHLPPPANVATTTDEFDPTGEIETTEQRAMRLARKKVPPALLGNIGRMNMDPSKNPNGMTDVTPYQ